MLREKNETASVQLEDTNREYQHTKVEYDRLEQELEELNRQMDELREKTQQNALQKQVQTTDYAEAGREVGLKFGPEDIHVMYRMGAY